MLMYCLLFIFSFICYLHVKQEMIRTNKILPYELTYYSNDNIQNSIKKKQPFIFTIICNPLLLQEINPMTNEDFDAVPTSMYYTNTVKTSYFKLFTSKTLILSDTKSISYSCNNPMLTDKLLSTTQMKIIKNIILCDVIPFPYNNNWLNNSTITDIVKFDYWFGSLHTKTPYEYHTNSAKYLIIMPNSEITVSFLPYNVLNELTKDNPEYYINNNNVLQNNKGTDIYINTQKINKNNRNDRDNDTNNIINNSTIMQNNNNDTDNITILFIPPNCWYSIEYHTNISSCVAFWYTTPVTYVSKIINKL